ncbi:MAG: hypothetical protein IPI30_08850 [Saprospiraceae bacterium]|nr:hypothetical protein [Candidatus Vicinibacter affinis]
MSKINFWIILLTISLLVSCDGESGDSHNCYFVGKWCAWVGNSCSNVLGEPQGIEFREDGHFSPHLGFSGAVTIYAWKSSDCETVIIYETQTGQNAKVQTYKITKVSNDIIVGYLEGYQQ